MRILLVTESYWPNADGGALFERRLVKGLVGRGHELAVWAPASKFKSYVQADGNYNIYRERAVTMPFNRKYKVSLIPSLRTKKIFKEFKPDAIHIHNPALLGRTAMRYANRHHIPVLATNHLMPENVFMNIKKHNNYSKWLYKKFWKYLVNFHNRAQFVTTPTQTALDYLIKNGLKTPSKAVTNGIDTAVFKPLKRSASIAKKYGIKAQPTVLYLGRVDGEKSIDVIIRAVAKLNDQADCQLVIAGFDKLHRLHKKPKSHTYLNMTDSAIVSKIAGDNGLSASVDSTSETHQYVVQHGQTDYEFDGYLLKQGEVVASGEMRMDAGVLADAFGRNDLILRTEDGRTLSIRFSGKLPPTGRTVAHADVRSGLPAEREWRRLRRPA